MNKKIIDAIKGGLWGLIVGDALGVVGSGGSGFE